MAGQKSILMRLLIIFIIITACKKMNSQYPTIIDLINQPGLPENLIKSAPLWAKYTKNSKDGKSRALIIFPGGEIFNYSQTHDSPTNKWYNWGNLMLEDLDKIKSILTNCAEEIDNLNVGRDFDDDSVLVQFSLNEIKYFYVTSKDYQNTAGQYLKAVNEAVNEALSNRNK